MIRHIAADVAGHAGIPSHHFAAMPNLIATKVVGDLASRQRGRFMGSRPKAATGSHPLRQARPFRR